MYFEVHKYTLYSGGFDKAEARVAHPAGPLEAAPCARRRCRGQEIAIYLVCMKTRPKPRNAHLADRYFSERSQTNPIVCQPCLICPKMSDTSEKDAM